MEVGTALRLPIRGLTEITVISTVEFSTSNLSSGEIHPLKMNTPVTAPTSPVPF